MPEIGENYLDFVSFVKTTGGGCGEYCPERRAEDKSHVNHRNRVRYVFRQHQLTERCFNNQGNTSELSTRREKSENDSGVGFGRISFHDAPASLAKHYIRVPNTSDPQMLMYFVENVWSLPRPKLVISISGGTEDFRITPELEQLLNDLMQIARKSNAWLITGGTKAGILKHCGMLHMLFASREIS